MDLDIDQDVPVPQWEQELADRKPPRTTDVVSGMTKCLPNEHTKLLGNGAPEEKAKVSTYVHTKYVGLLALFVVIWTNIFQAEAVRFLQTSIHFNKPFFVMCFCHAAPVLFLPMIFAYYRICGTTEDRHAGFDMVGVLQRHSIVPLRQLLCLSAFLGVFYLMCDYFWFSALQHLTVAAGAAIFNSSPLFVYCFSICLLHETVSCKKLFGVLTAFVEVTMLILYQDSGEGKGFENPSVVAGLLMLTSAILNAGYNVSVALTAGADINDTPTLMIMMGLSGIFTLPAGLIGTVFFAHSPFPSLYEPVGFPPTAEGNLMLTIGIVMFTTNFIFLTFAVCWTSPLETSVGFMPTIPLAGLIDTFVRHASFSWEFIVGALLVMAGFCILEVSSFNPPSKPHDNAVATTDQV